MGDEFKDIIRMDNQEIFMNPEEFGEMHLVGNRRMCIIIDNNEMIEREKRQSVSQGYRQGIHNEQVLFYVSAETFGALPEAGHILSLDEKRYMITDAIDESGIYSISMEAVR